MGTKQDARPQTRCAKLLRVEGEKRHDDAVSQHGTENCDSEDEQRAHKQLSAVSNQLSACSSTTQGYSTLDET